MFWRYSYMVHFFDLLAGYLLVKVETRTLTEEDILLAKAPDKVNCTMINILAGNFENPPDLEFLAMEAARGIAFDLNMSPEETEKYLTDLGVIQPDKLVWKESEE
jgi:hypothetical protein